MVAGGAVRTGSDLPSADQAFGKSLGFRSGRRGGGDLFQGDDAVRLAVAFEAARHRQFGRRGRSLGGTHVAMAGGAGNAPVHVRGVVEVGVARQSIDADPGEGFPRVARAVGIGRGVQGRQARIAGQDMAVAGQAGNHVGNPGLRGFLRGVVAGLAIDAEAAGVRRMGKRHGLFGRIYGRFFNGKPGDSVA